jgi:DNA-nicking Smr family endonuclease
LSAVAFNHDASGSSEAELDRLRGEAQAMMAKRKDLAHRSQEAYQRGDGALAKDLSNQAKDAAQRADDLNQQASNFIFRENNAGERAQWDELDLHGQHVDEAVEIFRQRIQAAKQQNQTHLHVIVGKGIHSADHIQKIKPAVEEACQQMGLAYRTESNAGRIYIDLTGNQNLPQYMPPPGQYHGGGQPQYQPNTGGGNQQQGGLTHQQEQQIEQGLAFCLKKCCTIM